jgi:hypothetical protein
VKVLRFADLVFPFAIFTKRFSVRVLGTSWILVPGYSTHHVLEPIPAVVTICDLATQIFGIHLLEVIYEINYVHVVDLTPRI